jgi:tRNA(fMet)-specific endonuclease VapC
MKLVLDTNAYRFHMEGRPDVVDLVRRAELVALPVPVIAELRFGFLNGTRGRQNEAVLARFLDAGRVRVLDCDEATTHFFAALKLQLKRQGTPIPLNDVWIAAIVVQHRGTLLTFDADFDHLPQLPRA